MPAEIKIGRMGERDHIPDWVGAVAKTENQTAFALATRLPVLTVGRQQLAAFTGPLADHAVLARVVDEPDDPDLRVLAPGSL